mgnify:CR=1 FL=1
MARHLITSAIPYINGIKHLGNLVGSQLPADLFARYQRARGNEVIFSDGTAQLRRMDPDTFEERDRFTVTLDGQPVTGLNELECVGDEVYANIFTTTNIMRIDARSGKVTAVIDASGLPNNAEPDPNNVLNGIAHLGGPDGNGQFLVTGKYWPAVYRVRFDAATEVEIQVR